MIGTQRSFLDLDGAGLIFNRLVVSVAGGTQLPWIGQNICKLWRGRLGLFQDPERALKQRLRFLVAVNGHQRGPSLFRCAARAG